MFPRLIIACLLMLALVMAFYVSGAASRPAEFRYLNKNDVHTLDPAQISWTQDIRAALNLWEGLTSYHPKTTEPMEGAAYFPPEVSKDGLIYTFRIRENARWSNGDPVTAADFVRGWRRALEPGTAADYATLLTDTVEGAANYYSWRNTFVTECSAIPSRPDYNRDKEAVNGVNVDSGQTHQRHVDEMNSRFEQVGIHATDDRTLQIHLKQPCAYFLDLCAFPTLLPCHESIEHLRERYGDFPITAEGLVVYDSQWTKPDYHRNGYPGLITNGPYQLTDWVFKRRLRMEANPHYWNAAAVRCRTIEAVVYEDLNTALMAYESGDLDFLTEMAVDYDHELVRLWREGLRPDFHFPSVFGTYFFIFNCGTPTLNGVPNPFLNARVRKAFALSIDKPALVDKVVGRGDPVSNHLVPVGSMAAYDSPQGLEYNPEAARSLLADAGYPGGAGLPVVELLYNTGYQHGKVSEVLAQMWQRELGVACILVGKEAKTFAEDKVQHRFMLARAGWYGDYGDPTTYLDIFTTGNGNNDAAYSNPRYDALVAEAGRILDPPARMAKLAEAEALLIQEEFPLLPLYQYTNLMAIKPYVKGIYPNPRLVFPFQYIRIER